MTNENARLLSLAKGEGNRARVDAILDDLHWANTEWDDAREALADLADAERAAGQAEGRAEIERLRAELEQAQTTITGLTRKLKVEEINYRQSQRARRKTEAEVQRLTEQPNQTPQPATLPGAVAVYARAVRDALTASGIDLDPVWHQGHGTPPTLRLHTNHRDPQGFCAVLDWDAVRGWSVAWLENTMGGANLHDRAWLGTGTVPSPKSVAARASEWLSAPDNFAHLAPANGDSRPLLLLLTAHTTAEHAPSGPQT